MSEKFNDTKNYFMEQLEQFFTKEEKIARIEKMIEDEAITIEALKTIEEELKHGK